MAELTMRKRVAQPGEIGLFPAADVFEEQWRSIKMDVDVHVKATTEAQGKYLRLSWHMANLMLRTGDEWEYSDEARDWLLVEAKHSRKVYDRLRGKAELKPKGTRHLDGTAWLELIPRMVHVLTTKLGIPEDEIFTDLSREEFFRRDEPPPITEIPDGPGMVGHNSRQATAGEAEEFPPVGEPPSPEPSPEPPVAREMPPETPMLARHYEAYAKWHIEHAAGHQAAMGWLWTAQQAQLRDKLGVSIGARKALERYCAERFGG